MDHHTFPHGYLTTNHRHRPHRNHHHHYHHHYHYHYHHHHYHYRHHHHYHHRHRHHYHHHNHHHRHTARFQVASDTKWVKANVDMLGYYRVQYDENNWKALADQLKSYYKVSRETGVLSDMGARGVATGGGGICPRPHFKI